MRNRAFATCSAGARPSAARLAGQSHRHIAAVVLDSDMTMRFGAVRLLAFELLLPPTRFSTRFVSASELIAFVDLVALGSSSPTIWVVLPLARTAAVTSDGELLPIRCSLFGCSHLQPVFNLRQCSLSRMAWWHSRRGPGIPLPSSGTRLPLTTWPNPPITPVNG